MKQACARLAAAVVLAALSSSCGDSSGPVTPDPPPPVSPAPPPEPAMAVIEMKVDLIEGELSPEDDKFLRLRWRIRLTESAGLDVKINFIRQDLLNRDFDQFERTEIGFDKVREACGTHIVRKNSQWQCDVRLDFNSSNFEGFLRLRVGVVDERDNNMIFDYDIPFFALE